MWFFIGSLTPFINPANEIIPACVQTGRREFMAVFKLHTEGSLRLHLPRPSCLFFNHLSDALLSFLFLLSLCSWVIIFHQGGGRSDLLTQTKGCGWGGGRRQGWEEKRGEGREGEKRERSFPRLLLRKSCSSLQPEYSWAAEAATHCPLPLPPSCVSLQYNTDTSNKAKSPDWCVCACPGLGWPQPLQLSESIGSGLLCKLKLSNPGVMRPGWTQVSVQLYPGFTADPRPAVLSHADAFGDPK